MNISIQCNNEDCEETFDVDLDSLERESTGASGHHLMGYTYEGTVQCPECYRSQEVEFVTEESDETEEILSITKVG